MKNMYTEQKSIKLIGQLEKTENGDFVCLVRNKDFVQEYNVLEILEQMVGTEINLQNIEVIEEII